MAGFEQLFTSVVADLRKITPREHVELGVIHGFCLDAAHSKAPNLIAFLSSIEGLDALAALLSRLPHFVQPVGIQGATWQFVESAPD
jgi:hypothetical protein